MPSSHTFVWLDHQNRSVVTLEVAHIRPTDGALSEGPFCACDVIVSAPICLLQESEL